jgi:hypothetical protein
MVIIYTDTGIADLAMPRSNGPDNLNHGVVTLQSKHIPLGLYFRRIWNIWLSATPIELMGLRMPGFEYLQAKNKATTINPILRNIIDRIFAVSKV